MDKRLEALLEEKWQFRFYRNGLGSITIEGTPNEKFINRNFDQMTGPAELAV